MEAIQSRQTNQGQPGRVMLYGRGVTPIDLKGKGSNSES